MKNLNRILLRAGLLSMMLAPAAHDLLPTANAQTPRQTDSILVQKDTIAALSTVPDSLLRERLAKLEKAIPLPYHQTVQAYVDLLAFRKTTYTRTMLERIPLFFPLYERMLAQYGLPDELKYLSIVESALDPRAISRSGAVGLWQFMPGTGRDLRLYQDDYLDERRDPVKANEAACKYLRDLYNIFGDWHLALAAYNSGPGTVKRAMRRSGGDSFWTIYEQLPKETRAYVPLYIATNYVMHFANDHGIYGENFDAPIPNDTIQVSGYFNLETFAKHSTVPLADLQKMNPALTTTILPEYTDRYPLRVPRQQFAYFSSHRRAILDSAGRLPVVMPHVLLAHAEDVRYGPDSTGGWLASGKNALARMSLEETPTEDETVTASAKEAEKQPKLAAHLATTEPAEQKITKARQKTEVATKTKRYQPRYHRVQHGDTLWNIVRRYDGLTIDRLKKMNHIRGNTLQPGQKLLVG